MSKPRAGRRWLVGSGITLLVAIFAGLSLAIRTAEPPRITLADGSTASVVAATSSAEPTVIGSPLGKPLYRMLPPRLRHWSGARVFPGAQSGQIHVWVRSSSPQPHYAATVVDAGSDASEGSVQNTVGDLLWFTFNTYPRRRELTTLSIYSPEGTTVGDWGEYSTGWKKLGELPLSLPAQKSLSHWDPPTLPVTGQVKDLQLSVTRLTVGEADRPDIPRKAGEVFASVAVRLTQGGRPASGWYADLEYVSDATGNRWRAYGRKFEDRADGSSRIIFTTPARPGEDVWNLHFVLRRATAAPPLPGEVWKLTGLPVPPPGKVIPVGRKTQLQGMAVELVGVYGVGTSVPSQIGNERVGGGGGFLIRIGGRSQEVDARVLALRDQQGRDIDRMSSVGIGGPNETLTLHLLAPAPSSRTFDFTYVVRRAQYVEVRAPRTLLKP